jgi:hypothetical protein
MENRLRFAFTVFFTLVLGLLGLVAAYDQLGGGTVQRTLAEHGLQGRLPLVLLAFALVLLGIAFAVDHAWEWYAWCRRAEYTGRADEMTAAEVDRGRKLDRHQGLRYARVQRLLEPSAYASWAAGGVSDADERLGGVFAEAAEPSTLRGLIIEGASLAGKTRLVVEWLRLEQPAAFVIAPRAGEPLAAHPRLRRFQRQGVCLLLDDLERFGPRVPEIVALLARLAEWKVPAVVLATVADGAPLSTVVTGPDFHPLRRQLLQLRLAPLSADDMAQVAGELQRPLEGDALEHEPTFAWLLRAEFRDAAARHAALPVRGRLALDAARALDERGVPDDGERWRRAAEDLFDFPRETLLWAEMLEALRQAGFLARDAPEPVYLRHVAERTLPPEQENRALRDGFVARGDHAALFAWGCREGFERGDRAAAVSLLRDALALPAPRPLAAEAAAQLALGRVLLLQGAVDGARAALERAWETGLRQGMPEGTETAMLAGAELAALLETQSPADAEPATEPGGPSASDGEAATEPGDPGASGGEADTTAEHRDAAAAGGAAPREEDFATPAREIRERVVALAGPGVGPHANAAAARCALELGRRALGASMLPADGPEQAPAAHGTTLAGTLLSQPVAFLKDAPSRIEDAEVRLQARARFEQALALGALANHVDALTAARAAGELAVVSLFEAGLSLPLLRRDPVTSKSAANMYGPGEMPAQPDEPTEARLEQSAEQMLRDAAELAARAGTRTGTLTAAWCALVLGLLFTRMARMECGRNIGRHAVFCADSATWLRRAESLADRAGGPEGLELASDATCFLGLSERDWRKEQAGPAFCASFEYGMRAGTPSGLVSACRACVHLAELEGAPRPPSYYSHTAAALGMGTRTVDFYRAALEIGIESGVMDAVPFLAEAAIQYMFTALNTHEPVELSIEAPKIHFRVHRGDGGIPSSREGEEPPRQVVPLFPLSADGSVIPSTPGENPPSPAQSTLTFHRVYNLELSPDGGLVMGQTLTYGENLPGVEKPHVRFPGGWQRGTPAEGGATTRIQVDGLQFLVPSAQSR